MSTVLLAREILEIISNMDKKNIFTNKNFIFRGEELFLIALDEAGGISTPSRLTEYTDFTNARLSAIIKALEGKGYILRHQDEIDKRCSIIEITEKGIEQSRILKNSAISNSLNMIEKLGQRDAEEFLRLMKKLFEIMTQEEGKGE